jgi:outer membrane protein assembly factor BamB
MIPLLVSGRLSVYRIVCLVAMVAMLGGCGLFGGDEEEDPPAELVKFKSTLKIKKAWSSGVGDGAEHLRLALEPATDGSRIYVGDHDGQISAFDAVKGNRIWRVKTKLALSAGPAVNATAAVFGSSDGDVIALDIRDGHELWRTSVSSEVLASPAVTSSLALVRTVDGRLVALSLEDGSELWFVQQSVPRLSVRGTGAPVVDDRMVICGFDNGKLAAYELGDGSMIWDLMLAPPSGRTEVDRLSDLNSTIRIVGDDIYVVGYQSSLSAVAIESGQVLWSRDISSHTGVGIDFNNLYISGESSKLFAVSRRSGRELWQMETLLNRDITGPTTYRSSVVVGDFNGYLHWFDATTGELQARVRAGSDRISAPPLVINEILYVLTDGGKLYAFKDVTKKPKS